ncbi:MAG: tRNA (5-methylaminomethyl-2-thiouridylate)-methyltransferase [Polyangiaceae bacterium]|jgi:tRNA-specific 2-thiouridylase|nr:tRNA (5-methylaminomethyl-2-thiouridylate)-methyltransferase [Polyangiaceae bacterium]
MSGGVDSSVAAARLLSQGFDVVGVTLHLWDYPDDGSVKSRCCAPEDIHDARRVADALGFPHYAFDRRELFQREVIAPFVDGYLEGETPSPCVRCNRGVKIKELMQLADRLDASRVATGHYARLVQREGRTELHRGRDAGKDQSYFLHMLPESTLSRLCFPLGDSGKAEVRAEALQLALPGAEKGESQELCFVPTGRYDTFVGERANERVRPGPIVDEGGKVVGQHAGVHRFTVGQRRNLGVALGKPSYVVSIDAEAGRIELGPVEKLMATSADLSDVSLASDVTLPLDCEVQVRYRGTPLGARVVKTEGGVRVRFEKPVQAVVPGQFAVFYAGDRVLGGGLIRRAEPMQSKAEPAEASP